MEPTAITTTAILTTATLSTTVYYSLPTTGDKVIYERHVTSGDILIMAPIWILVVIQLFRLAWDAAKGRL